MNRFLQQNRAIILRNDEKLRNPPTENDVDSEIVPPYEPRDAFDLVRLQCRRDAELFSADTRVSGRACVIGEYDIRRGFEPLLVIHRLRLSQRGRQTEREIIDRLFEQGAERGREEREFTVTKIPLQEFHIYKMPAVFSVFSSELGWGGSFDPPKNRAARKSVKKNQWLTTTWPLSCLTRGRKVAVDERVPDRFF